MYKYVLFGHGGSGNHGCEAIVRSTVSLLDTARDDVLLSSYKSDQDIKYGLDKICDVIQSESGVELQKMKPDYILAYIKYRLNGSYEPFEKLLRKHFALSLEGKVAVSIGGDAYCYKGDDEILAEYHGHFVQNGMKTVLWGCSLDPSLLENSLIREDMRRFDLITARESISYEALKAVNHNTVLVCDSAFHLDSVEKPMPEGAENLDLVCLNSSPLIESCETNANAARENYRNLIKYILDNTNFGILLVPHVVWDNNDDRSINREFFGEFGNTGRVFMIEDAGCEVLKGYIARCRFAVCARTHASIAAYSSQVPTLVVGYSVKSKGIAKDLFGTYDNYVLPVQSLKSGNELSNAFKWLMENEEEMKNRLKTVMPEYKARIGNGLKAIDDLL